MKNSLTRKQLESLELGAWVWVIDLKNGRSAYVQKDTNSIERFNQLSWLLPYADYGIKWLAYVNKEQAESKNRFIELKHKRGYYIANQNYLPNAWIDWTPVNQIPLGDVLAIDVNGRYFSTRKKALKELILQQESISVPMTLEEVKQLVAGDEVMFYIKSLGFYKEHKVIGLNNSDVFVSDIRLFSYETYGTEWTARRIKEEFNQ